MSKPATFWLTDELNKVNKGSIYKGKTWNEIFEIRKNPKTSKSWWIEKVYNYKEKDSLFADKSFSHYQLKCEEGLKNKIPTCLNDYIKNNFKDEKYITQAI